VAGRLVVDLDLDGRVSVAAWLEGDEIPPARPTAELAWPLDDDVLEELRWYLEDYLAAPFGVYGDRGPKVQEGLAEWGAVVFGAVFGSGPARDAYVRARRRSDETQLVFRSSSPVLLALPWELMRDPSLATPLALDLEISRSLPGEQHAEPMLVDGSRLRVLMVISRPAGTRDVEYQMIARPLLKLLGAVRGAVDLVVLRPPTLDALAETLAKAAAAGDPFQVVHFDGHGTLHGSGPAAESVLIFERPGGGPDAVTASRLARILENAKVPLVVLNACQSGAIGKDLEAAIATRLLQEGTASVVAMAYTVYAVAAAEFMAAFYDRLFAGDTVSAAVTAGRQRIFTSNRRPSPKGDMPLADWLVPVHYLGRDVRFPQARVTRAAPIPSDEIPGTADGDGTADLDPAGSFVARDALFYLLEIAARWKRVVVLHGPGGAGKTELAKAFGRWWRDTSGVDRPELVFYHSFEPGVATFGLHGVINEIGMAVFGADFAKQDAAERRAAVEKVLAEQRALLIWDSFETVRSMPDPDHVTSQLDEDSCRELKDFLSRLAESGRSAVLITSRAAEEWLGDLRRIPVGGLTPREANEYANHLLESSRVARQRRATWAFGELMEWLDGNPLSMRLILPHLDTTEPDKLLGALRGTAPLPGQDLGEGGRMTSLGASIAYSYAHLAESTRRLLPAICLFQGVADQAALAVLPQVPDVPRRFADATNQDWDNALNDAARVGLLTKLSPVLFRIHPALPAYLAAQWRNEEPLGHDAMREAAARAMVTVCGAASGFLEKQIRGGDAGLAFTTVRLQYRTLGTALRYALAHGFWKDAQRIAQPLDSYWDVQGLIDEADAWADQMRTALEDADGTPPDIETPAGALWIFMADRQAARHARQHRLDEAEAGFHRIRVRLETIASSEQQKRHLTVNYGQLAAMAQLQRRPSVAEDWYRKALTIYTELDDKPGIARTYDLLSSNAKLQDQTDHAENWHRKSLAVHAELGSKQDIASTYHHLGVAAENAGRQGEAQDWHRRTPSIHTEPGDKRGTADAYCLAGLAALKRDSLGEAQEWYRKALAVYTELGDKRGAADTYRLLGMLAQKRDSLGEAEDWYRKALSISEVLADKHGMGTTYRYLATLAIAGSDDGQALEWAVRCVALFEEFPDPSLLSAMDHLSWLTHRLGIGELEKCWRKVTGDALPQLFRYVEVPLRVDRSAEHSRGRDADTAANDDQPPTPGSG
jgi:tetratricopeptide (TPR) repeat protein